MVRNPNNPRQHEIIRVEDLESEIDFNRREIESKRKMKKLSEQVDKEVKENTQEAAIRDKNIREELNDLDGFERTSTTSKARIVSILSKLVKSGGKVLSRRDLIRQKINEGFRVKGTRLSNKHGAFIDDKALTKTGIDYAAYLGQRLDSSMKPK